MPSTGGLAEGVGYATFVSIDIYFHGMDVAILNLCLRPILSGFFFSTRPSLGLLPVLGPLGGGTDATHLPSPSLSVVRAPESWSKPFLQTFLNLFCSFQSFFSDFTAEITEKRLKMNKKMHF